MINDSFTLRIIKKKNKNDKKEKNRTWKCKQRNSKS